VLLQQLSAAAAAVASVAEVVVASSSVVQAEGTLGTVRPLVEGNPAVDNQHLSTDRCSPHCQPVADILGSLVDMLD
jgi:hypothetical protein